MLDEAKRSVNTEAITTMVVAVVVVVVVHVGITQKIAVGTAAVIEITPAMLWRMSKVLLLDSKPAIKTEHGVAA